jgi:hypothetical protein
MGYGQNGGAAHLIWEQEVGGSNLLAPTIVLKYKRHFI